MNETRFKKKPVNKQSDSQTAAQINDHDISKKQQDDLIAGTILALCTAAGAEKTICPVEAARAVGRARGEDELAWRHWLHHVRTTAIGLARKGHLVIYRKGKPADPENFRGVYRLGLPRSD